MKEMADIREIEVKEKNLMGNGNCLQSSQTIEIFFAFQS